MALDGKSRGRQNYWILVALLCLLSVSIRIVIPIRPGFLGLHDDDWMVSNAYWLLNGELVRPWSILAMNKELGYPIFVAFSMFLRISPVLLTHLIFVALALLLTQVMSEFFSKRLNLYLLSALVLNPAIFGLTASRIYRDMLTINLALGLFVIAIHFCKLGTLKLRARRVAVLSIIGFLLSMWLRMTRVDTYWLILVIAIATGPLSITLIRQILKTRKVCIGELGVVVFLAAVCVGQIAAPIVSAQINDERYGVRLADDFFQGEFASLLRTWSSIEGGASSYTPINEEQRSVAYGESTFLKRLEPFIEGDFSSGWRSISCQATDVCDDIAGGYFAHAVRDAYSNVYPESSAGEFQQFMRRANRELIQACSSGRISCGDRGINTQLPSLWELDWAGTVKVAGSFVLSRSLRFNDSLNFDSVGLVDGPNSVAWKSLLSRDLFTKSVNQNGTPSEIRSLLKSIFNLASWTISLTVSVGLLALTSLAFRQRHRLTAWIGLGSVIGVAAHAFVIGIAAQNSMGPLSFGGVWELTYLLQEIPFLVIAGIVGIEMLFFALNQRKLTKQSELVTTGVE